jgi:hypothetical protein
VPHEWRSATLTGKPGVLALMQRAALVVIRPDVSRGVEWELETAIRNVDPQRLVLLLPDDADTLSIVRQHLGSILPGGSATLPELDAPRGFEGLRGVLDFDPRWLPRFRPAGSPTTRRLVLRGRARGFETLLAPVLDRLTTETSSLTAARYLTDTRHDTGRFSK